MKFPEPPSWPVIRWCNLIVALICTAGAISSETKWTVMADMAAAGAMLASWIWIGRIIQLGAIINVAQDLIVRQLGVIENLRRESGT